jgi:hypothetical protein
VSHGWGVTDKHGQKVQMIQVVVDYSWLHPNKLMFSIMEIWVIAHGNIYAYSCAHELLFMCVYTYIFNMYLVFQLRKYRHNNILVAVNRCLF